jgi:hypothetical protein
MANLQQLPWVILLCRYSDDANDPVSTTISDLNTEWTNSFGSDWVANNLPATAGQDTRTILDVYNTFFTSPDAWRFGCVRYWSDMSHGIADVSGSRVFPCTLNMTKAAAAAAAVSPGGAAYQNDIFQKAKDALQQQHGVDSQDFAAVAVSFQSPDFGAQGGIFDKGPGVFMDIRFVIGNGTQSWGQEMGHAFGLDHSRQQGSNDDYLDPWDAMSTRAAYSGPDPFFGMRGPGFNAWNMRGRQWLDESRVWKPSSPGDFSQTITLRPLHRRDLSGYLAAELPGIGTDSAYLVELRVPRDWDLGIPAAAVLVHRFEGPIGQFLGTHSYVMPGTGGQFALSAGGHFEVGKGPFSHVKVLSIDGANDTATVELCHSVSAKLVPTVSIVPATRIDNCSPVYVAGGTCKFVYKLSLGPCGQNYSVLWSVTGAIPSPGVKNDGPSYEVVLPDPSIVVRVAISVVFSDGTMINGSLEFKSMTQDEARWREFICELLHERKFPTPWWQWNPASLTPVIRPYSKAQLQLIEGRIESLLNVVKRAAGHSV